MSTKTFSTPEALIHLSPEVAASNGSREAVLRQLLPYDYEYARDSGLIDMFYYNPETGEDGLLHTLAGNMITGPDGSLIPHGFHHEPSGRTVWGEVMDPEGGSQPITRVDHVDLATANSEKRRIYAQYLAEPFRGQVTIAGRPKYAAHRVGDGDEVVLERSKNSMYPNEYDALAVMQAVRIAHQGRETADDKPGVNDKGEPVLVNDSSAPLIDGKSRMGIRLILDPETGLVKTAIPLVPRKPGIMKLTPEQLLGHITYGMSGEKPSV